MQSNPRGVHARPSPAPHHPGADDRPRRPRTATGLVVAAVVLFAGSITAAPATASTPLTAEGCAPDAVTVVVDFTELGGGIDSGCAEAGGSGTDALIAAGFTETRDAGGYICAVDALPDPCPVEFTGSFWSYWHGTPDGQWQSYDVGSDDSAPEAGSVEGWRYGDGTVAPDVAPDASSIAPAATSESADAEAPGVGTFPTAAAGISLLVLLAVAALLVARRRSGLSRGDGPAGQD